MAGSNIEGGEDKARCRLTGRADAHASCPTSPVGAVGPCVGGIERTCGPLLRVGTRDRCAVRSCDDARMHAVLSG